MARRAKPKDGYHHGNLREVLLRAAIELIAERGAHGLSLRECARRAGVSHAAPYRHFADKDALLFAIAELGFEKLYAAGVAAMEGVEDPLERLDAYGIAYVRFALENPVLLRVMFTLQFEVPDDAEDVGAPAFDLLQQAAAEVVGPDVDSYTAAFAAWSLPHGLSMLVLDGRVPPELVEDPDGIEKLARSVYAIWRGPFVR